MKEQIAVTILCLLVAGSTFADSKVLIPLAFRSDTEVRGANGTIWRGAVWIGNTSKSPVPFGSTGLETPFFPAAYFGLADQWLDDLPDPGFIWAPASPPDGVFAISARIFEVTRHAQPQGVEVPVVPLSQFAIGQSLLLGIPGGTAVRTALRVYHQPVRLTGETINVEILDDARTVVATGSITTSYSHGHMGDFYRPGFGAIFNLADVFPVVRSMDHYHIRLTCGSNYYWAMASVTDNDTQQVLFITPYPK